jgi:CubicO group peptidase (beta-lactamase class C family)
MLRPILVLAVVAIVGFQQSAPSSDLAARLQSALDEWRASTGAPGASLGVVLNDGQVFGLASGLADRAARAVRSRRTICSWPARPARPSSQPWRCSSSKRARWI